MKITLISHGQTEEEFLRKVLGRSNVMLNDTGRRQVQRLRQKIVGNDYSYCYMSPLVRDVETAMILIGDRVEMIPDKRLIARDTGEFEGDLLDNYNLYKYWDYDIDKSDFKVEKISSVISRVQSFFDYIIDKYDDNSSILIVVDSSTYRVLRLIIKKIPLVGNLLDGIIGNCQMEEFNIKK